MATSEIQSQQTSVSATQLAQGPLPSSEVPTFFPSASLGPLQPDALQPGDVVCINTTLCGIWPPPTSAPSSSTIYKPNGKGGGHDSPDDSAVHKSAHPITPTHNHTNTRSQDPPPTCPVHLNMTATAEPRLTVSTSQPMQTAGISQDKKPKRKFGQRSLGERKAEDGDATLVARIDAVVVPAHHRHTTGAVKSGGAEVRVSWAGLWLVGLVGLALGIHV